MGNKIVASSPTNELEETYPLSVTTVDNTAMVLLVNGGKSYVPVVFKGLREVNEPKLWKADGACWELVDQSNWGKDFWQADYQAETATFGKLFFLKKERKQKKLSLFPALTSLFLLGE